MLIGRIIFLHFGALNSALGPSAHEFTIYCNSCFFSDAPKILRITGGGTVGVHNKTIMTCSAEGNPLPKYQWLQKMPSQQVPIIRFVNIGPV